MSVIRNHVNDVTVVVRAHRIRHPMTQLIYTVNICGFDVDIYNLVDVVSYSHPHWQSQYQMNTMRCIIRARIIRFWSWEILNFRLFDLRWVQSSANEQTTEWQTRSHHQAELTIEIPNEHIYSCSHHIYTLHIPRWKLQCRAFAIRRSAMELF